QEWWPGTNALLLASGDAAGNVIVWEGTAAASMAAGTHPDTATTAAITDVRWAANTAHFAVGSQDGAVRLFDAHQSASLATWLQGKDAVSALTWQRAQNLVAVALANGSLQLWNAANNHLFTTLPGAPTNITSLAWSADARWLAAGAADGRILLWNTSNLG
nr:hypothetical protein [Ktedonobacterales bacterium]